jgi:hypothetical protein
VTGVIFLPTPTPWVGPGCLVGWNSDFIGPLQTGSHIDLQLATDPEFTGTFIQVVMPVEVPSTSIRVLVDGQTTVPRVQTQPAVGTPVHIGFQLFDGTQTNPIDTEVTQAPWDPVAGAYQVPVSGQGGFTESDRLQLQATEKRTQVLGEPEQLVIQQPSGPVLTTLGQIFSRQTLDALTLDELTSGPTFDPVRVQFAGWYYGVIVRVTTIAEDLVPKTPDSQWYFPDLAVLRIFRGADLEYRRGIHTPTFMQEQPWQWGSNILNTFDVLGVPPDLTIAVDWRPGCAGQVFLQRLP